LPLASGCVVVAGRGRSRALSQSVDAVRLGGPRGNRPRRWVAPEALAEVILFLASDAARAIHGAAIPVTGLV